LSSHAIAQQYATEWSDKPQGAVYNTPDGGKIRISPGPGITQNMKQVEADLIRRYGKLRQNYVNVAQYAPQSQIQYHPPSFFQGSGGPVVVPPTVINTQPNRCRQKRINLFLFFDVESSDC
jgi:anthranilate/para-aminobenzoate synthase component II